MCSLKRRGKSVEISLAWQLLRARRTKKRPLFKLIVLRQGYFMSMDRFTIESVIKGILEAIMPSIFTFIRVSLIILLYFIQKYKVLIEYKKQESAKILV